MPTADQPFTLESRSIDALPLVNHLLTRVRLGALLTQHVPAGDRRRRLAPATALGVLVRNLLLGRVPLYSQPEWAARAVPPLLGLRPAEVAQLTDDQVGRALDRLFDADRATLLTQVVVQAVTAFGVDLAQLHNDSTTVTFTGEYRGARGRTLRGRRALAIGYGHNKDHRPDLKQLLFVLTVSADGAVPIHYQACDGNTEDSTTHHGLTPHPAGGGVLPRLAADPPAGVAGGRPAPQPTPADRPARRVEGHGIAHPVPGGIPHRLGLELTQG